MRLGRFLAVGATLSLLHVLWSKPAQADFGTTSQASDSGTVTVTAETSPVFGIGSGGGGDGPVCQWRPLRLDRDPGDESFEEGDIPFSPAGVGPEVIEEIGGVEHRLYRVTCPDGSVTDRWVVSGATVADLIPGVRDRASEVIGAPEPRVNPPVASGGIVNVGLWLAVAEQPVPPVSAEAGSVWISVVPRLISTRYAFGNGDVIECDGAGVPIESVHPDLDVVEESPTCGYTYRRSSPDDTPYQLTITAVWALPYQSSSGAGSIPALERSITVDYDVDEVQTIGISN